MQEAKSKKKPRERENRVITGLWIYVFSMIQHDFNNNHDYIRGVNEGEGGREQQRDNCNLFFSSPLFSLFSCRERAESAVKSASVAKCMQQSSLVWMKTEKF